MFSRAACWRWLNALLDRHLHGHEHSDKFFLIFFKFLAFAIDEVKQGALIHAFHSFQIRQQFALEGFNSNSDYACVTKSLAC